jgi:hypothetical protein
MKRILPLAFLAGFALTGNGDAPAQSYVNAFAGVTLFDSTKTVGGVKLIDQGGDAATAGLRAGWGHRFPAGLYLGAEAELFGASGRSRACVNGQCFSFTVDGGAGAFARAGWETQGRALFFVRGGTQVLFTNQGTQWAPAIGIGAEIPFAPRWRARLDITYAWTDRDKREFTQVSAGAVYEW